MEAQTYVTGQRILKFDNWIPRGTRGRTGLQAEIRVLEKKREQSPQASLWLTFCQRPTLM